jgi:hypothetical protein
VGQTIAFCGLGVFRESFTAKIASHETRVLRLSPA